MRFVDESSREIPMILATPIPMSHDVAARKYVHVMASTKRTSAIINVREPATTPPATSGERRAIAASGDMR
jgi:hypothetical protein